MIQPHLIWFRSRCGPYDGLNIVLPKYRDRSLDRWNILNSDLDWLIRLHINILKRVVMQTESHAFDNPMSVYLEGFLFQSDENRPCVDGILRSLCFGFLVAHTAILKLQEAVLTDECALLFATGVLFVIRFLVGRLYLPLHFPIYLHFKVFWQHLLRYRAHHLLDLGVFFPLLVEWLH